MADIDYLAWPFFEDRHRAFAAEMEAWAARHADALTDHHDADASTIRLNPAGAAIFGVPADANLADEAVYANVRMTQDGKPVPHDSFAWMNAASVAATLATGKVTYWSRSRAAFWVKGETSGHHQRLVELRVDCDRDCLLVLVEQEGPACHTGRRSCFYTAVREGEEVEIMTPVHAGPEGHSH